MRLFRRKREEFTKLVDSEYLEYAIEEIVDKWGYSDNSDTNVMLALAVVHLHKRVKELENESNH